MNVLSVLKYGDITLMSAIDRFPAAQLEEEGALGWWSVKDIIAHMTSNEHFSAQVLDNILTGEPIATLAGLQEHAGNYNDHEVRRRREMAPAEILAEYAAAHQRVKALAAQIPAEKFRENGAIPWYGAEYCLDDFLVYSNYAHKREHAGHIDVFRDRVEARAGG